MFKHRLETNQKGTKKSKKVNTIKQNALAIAMGLFAAGNTVTAFADAEGAINALIDYVGVAFTAVGLGFALWGAVQVVMAFRDENGEGKVKGFTMIAAGAVLTQITEIAKAVMDAAQ